MEDWHRVGIGWYRDGINNDLREIEGDVTTQKTRTSNEACTIKIRHSTIYS